MDVHWTLHLYYMNVIVVINNKKQQKSSGIFQIKNICFNISFCESVLQICMEIKPRILLMWQIRGGGGIKAAG